MIKRVWMFGCRCVLGLSVGIVALNLVVIGFAFPWAAAAAAGAVTWRNLERRWRVSGNFGNARFATMADVIQGGMLSAKGWFMGKPSCLAPPSRERAIRSLFSPRVSSDAACRMLLASLSGPRWRDHGFIRISDGVHAATFAPAGSGKSTRVLIPNLLSHAGNCVVIDTKGELFQTTAEHRRKVFGHKIVRLDPASLCGPRGNRFNPFDWIDPNAGDFIDVCRDFANMLVVKTGKELDPHWNDSAENVVAAFIAHVCASEQNPEFRNLRGMRSLIASRQAYSFALEAMKGNESLHGVLQQLGYQLDWHVDRELGSVMTHAQRHTNIFDSPLIVDNISATDWNPAELRTGRMTVYLVVPPHKLVIWAGLMRLWLGSILRITTQGTPSERNPVLYLVDECAHIGRMQALEDGITLMRGMGVRMWLFFQSLDQLNKCFGDHASTVLDNLATQQFFAISSYETAEALSKRMGDETVINMTDGSNAGSSQSSGVRNDGFSRNSGSSVSYAESGRRLLRAEEILTLPNSVALLFHKNYPVILCETVEYFSHKAFRRRWLGYGTGRSPSMALGGLVMAIWALILAGLVSLMVARLPELIRPMPPAMPVHSKPRGEFF